MPVAMRGIKETKMNKTQSLPSKPYGLEQKTHVNRVVGVRPRPVQDAMGPRKTSGTG